MGRAALIASCIARPGLGLLIAASALAMAADPSVSPMCPASPQRTIIWQPWAAHAGLDASGWRALGQEVQRQGYAHVLLQWASYGDHEFWPRGEAGWLATGLRQWETTGLKLIFGLHMDPDYYRVLQQPDPVLRAHLAASRDKSVALARRVLRRPPPLELAGWYLPQEIDDLNWQSPARERMLRNYLAPMRDALSAMAPGAPQTPLYASVFYSGASSPEDFARMLLRLHRGTGVVWIVQDGLGTDRLPPERTAAYLRAVASTLPPEGWRALLEVFDEQRTPGQPPRFEPSDEATIARRAGLWCLATGRQAQIVFSLNQVMAGMLPLR
ncbi:DUF4434 domain-containing protein [Variovorax sp. J22R133]|uniref:DUF4434 domain-containing protein n=1 Tax=Variovorax brevis TaxID=3053503 RepID=UPI0025792109|nr:DUF4434 domain-containing protein [Variovorax sp. J22R133]MDM0110822.1 DUF4434 domain-containing protein [Variovorax sp. J22R133]